MQNTLSPCQSVVLPTSPLLRKTLFAFKMSELKRFRTALMLTQGELAALVGVNQSVIANIELGKIPERFTLTYSEHFAVHLIRLAKFNRVTAHLKQVELAALTGITQKEISILRRGRMKLRPKRFEKVLAALGIPEPETTESDLQCAYQLFERIRDDEGYQLEQTLSDRGIQKQEFAKMVGLPISSVTWLFTSERFSKETRARIGRALGEG